MPPPSSGLGKNGNRWKKGSEKSSGKAADKSSRKGSEKGSEKGAPEEAPQAGGLEERGAFAYGRCDKCGWQGPARRSRERARKDLLRHVDDKPKHADHTTVAAGLTHTSAAAG